MLEKTYSPADIEARIDADWAKADAFKAGRADRAGAASYCVVIPPPNVTGSLHIGHALNNTLQDILCRYERLLGKDVLWQPGMDHAGIATQLVVTRKLAEKQIQYQDLGREKFLEEVWRWKAESGGTIINQLKRLGASCDWSRERFTMDEGLSKAVLKVFVDLHKAGLLYKDKRLVNWDPVFQSAISDLEVEPREHTGSFKWSPELKDKDGNPVPFDGAALAKVLARDPSGHMYYIRYAIAGSPGEYVTVGTTRPETMLGDTGVAIHPENEKLKHLIGKKAILPLVGREIPVVGDTYADPEKGTGAVKITPAHDFNDWDVGKRCGLEVINILDATAKLNDDVPPVYRGLDRFIARAKVVADLVALGAIEKIEPHTHAVPHAQRGDAVVEPWLTDQWYVDAATLAKPAMEAVRAGKTTFVPDKYAADYFRWLENIQPWCVSRQLWWGHRIPAWYGPKYVPNPRHSIDFDVTFNPAGSKNLEEVEIFVAETEVEALALARKHYGRSVSIGDNPRDYMRSDDGTLEITIWRDPDVLDTWFSSALWPFSTLGWPEQTKELGRFYPTSCLVTGFDIIFFWVARMMMFGTHFMKEVPFHDVFIHGLVRDEKGRKMSKTLGNSIDPLELIDQYGADALRFTLAALTTQGRDVKISTARVEGYRNFATKLWNAARFMEVNECRRVENFDPKAIKHTLNRWIAGETQRAVAEVEAALKVYKFNEAAGAAYQFVWGVTCDWYLELAKPLLTGDDAAAKAETQATAAWLLDQILPLLHPFMPFITEELWAKTAEHGPARQSVLALASWPRLSALVDTDAAAEIGWVVSLVSEIRSVRSEMNVPGGAKVPLVLVSASATTKARAERHDETLKRLARLDAITFADQAPKGAAQIIVGDTTAAIPLAGVIDMGAEAKRLAKEIDKTVSEIKKVTDRLDNPQFMAKAPEDVIDELRERQADFEARQGKLKIALSRVEDAA
jgi:valyl-tRNA synthetase